MRLRKVQTTYCFDLPFSRPLPGTLGFEQWSWDASVIGLTDDIYPMNVTRYERRGLRASELSFMSLHDIHAAVEGVVDADLVVGRHQLHPARARCNGIILRVGSIRAV